ncbi:FAD:protein FMN transferase [Myxococcota bacterium]|nr:FAD:protein FMN transferase [Myxococcota bacterium]
MRPVAIAPALVVILVLACASPPPPPDLVSDGRLAMGTVLEMSIVPPAGASPREAREILDRAFERVQELEGLVSRYQPDSQISRLNRSAGLDPKRVDPRLADLLARALSHSQLTGGAFDVTVGPLVELWVGAADSGQPPSADALASARSKVGSDRVRVGDDGDVEFLEPGVSVNLGGIAKGYALDELRPLLAEAGVHAALLSFGQSSTWAIGAPPGEAGWTLLVRGATGPIGLILLRDQALSVSGSLGQFVEIGGVSYGHVLDPRTGWPLTEHRLAVVVAPDAALAEALSTALLIGGEEEGLDLVEALPDCEGLVETGRGEVRTTAGWRERVSFERLAPAQRESRGRSILEVDQSILDVAQ